MKKDLIKDFLLVDLTLQVIFKVMIKVAIGKPGKTAKIFVFDIFLNRSIPIKICDRSHAELLPYVQLYRVPILLKNSHDLWKECNLYNIFVESLQ